MLRRIRQWPATRQLRQRCTQRGRRRPTNGQPEGQDALYEQIVAECEAAEAALYSLWYNETYCPLDVEGPGQSDDEWTDDGISVEDGGQGDESSSSEEWWYGDLIAADEQEQQMQRAADDYEAAEAALHSEWFDHTHGSDSQHEPATPLQLTPAALQQASTVAGAVAFYSDREEVIRLEVDLRWTGTRSLQSYFGPLLDRP